jgi:hypothetical protein
MAISGRTSHPLWSNCRREVDSAFIIFDSIARAQEFLQELWWYSHSLAQKAFDACKIFFNVRQPFGGAVAELA